MTNYESRRSVVSRRSECQTDDGGGFGLTKFKTAVRHSTTPATTVAVHRIGASASGNGQGRVYGGTNFTPRC